MRKLFVVAALGLAACAPDPMIGSYSFTITGTETQTAPTSGSSTPSGTGTLAITAGKTDAYLVTVGHSDISSCTLKGTKKAQQQDMKFELLPNQPCILKNGGTVANAVITSGTVSQTITQVSSQETRRDVSLAISYTWSYTALGFNFVGTGNRTYAGPEM